MDLNFLYILYKKSKIIRRINLGPFLNHSSQYSGSYYNISKFSDGEFNAY